MADNKKDKIEDNDIDFNFGDFGNFDIPDLDIDAFDFVPDEISELESRYIKPKLKPMKKDYVLYDNALKFAKETKIDFNERIYAMIAGSFIFGDFIEAFFTTHNVNATEMIISTLSLSQENIDSLHNLLIHGYVDKLTILVSDYFYSHERFNLVPYMYEMLDINDSFQLAVAFVHTKTIQFKTAGGRNIVIHGSANLRSSGNVEQFCMEESEELYNFFKDRFQPIIDEYSTINKRADRKTQWKLMSNKTFKNY